MELPQPPAKPVPNKVTWGPLAGILGSILMFVISQVIGVLLLFMVAAVIGGHSFSEAGQAGSFLEQPVYIFLGNGLVAAILFGLVYSFIRYRKGTLRSAGLDKFKTGDAVYALAGYGIYFVSFIAMSALIRLRAPELLEQEQNLGFSRDATGPVLSLIFVSLVILPPLVEEILFRGFLYTGLRQRANAAWSIAITSLIFGGAHLFGGDAGTLLWVAAADTFILSLVLCGLRERTGSLWPPILLHGIKNFVAFAALFIFKVG